jgi:hypothetical protein
MTATNLARPAILMAFLTIIAVISWEFHLRQQGVGITYNDSQELWADKRSRIYQDPKKATVFIGSSRIKYALDISSWQRITGREAVQLAMEGKSPLSVLEDLANDPEFKGNLVVDVTELFYYSLDPAFNGEPKVNIKYFHDQTYAQKIGFQLNRALESKFVFLNEKSLSLSAKLGDISVKDRNGVYMPPKFPMEFINNGFERQSKMEPEFLSSPQKLEKVRSVWVMIMEMIKNSPPPTENPVPKVIKITKDAVEKIRGRGGDVVFVRTPSSGPFYEMERKTFARSVFWDPLLTATKCEGIHFMDHAEMNHLDCPEWSHLSPKQAIEFTASFIRLLPSKFTGH